MTAQPPRALIAEDEPLLAAALRAELAKAWPELRVLATVGDGLSAVREALREDPEGNAAWCRELAQALQDWCAWPVLTPALRRTLACLEEPEQWALMEDLRAGGGDVFCYGPALPEAAEISVDGAGGQFSVGQFTGGQ